MVTLQCREPESNWRHRDFQSRALPTELSRRVVEFYLRPRTPSSIDALTALHALLGAATLRLSAPGSAQPRFAERACEGQPQLAIISRPGTRASAL